MKLDELKTNTENPEIYVLVGVPGSGKSTWTRQFLASSEKKFVVVSSDDLLEVWGAAEGLSYSESFNKYIKRASVEVERMFKDAKQNRQNIILDRTNLSANKRKGILQNMPKEYIKVAVMFETPSEEIERRLAAREAETGKHIPASVMKDMYSRAEPPSVAEGFNKILFA